jgi:hypothetical protein
MANAFIGMMPHLVDLGKDKNGNNVYINMSSISHIVDTGTTLHCYMYSTPVDRYGQLQPLILDGQIRETLLNFVEDFDIEATETPVVLPSV